MKRSRLSIPAGLARSEPSLFADPRRGKRYHNPWGSPPLPGVRELVKWQVSRHWGQRRQRVAEIQVIASPLAGLAKLPSDARLLWLGHASFLVEVDGIRVLIDPIFGPAGRIIPRISPAALSPTELPPLDAVLISHGHHDHLDPPSLRALSRRFGPKLPFIVPTGLGRCLPRACRHVLELDWWQTTRISSVEICLVPAQHWHRRITDHNRALWGGFVLRGSKTIYHSGDTGYFSGFRAIAEVVGAIDITCLPLGAYLPRLIMQSQHMDPKESIQAFHDLGAAHFVGMHWGTFDLSDEAIDAGPDQLRQEIVRHPLEEHRFHILWPGGSLGLDAQGSCQCHGVAMSDDGD